MQTLVAVAQWIADNIFAQPAFLIGAIVLIGLLVQRKSVNDVVSGTTKAIIGFLLITLGAGIITAALEVFQPLWSEVFGFGQPNLGEYAGFETFSSDFGSAVALAMTFGF